MQRENWRAGIPGAYKTIQKSFKGLENHPYNRLRAGSDVILLLHRAYINYYIIILILYAIRFDWAQQKHNFDSISFVPESSLIQVLVEPRNIESVVFILRQFGSRDQNKVQNIWAG